MSLFKSLQASGVLKWAGIFFLAVAVFLYIRQCNAANVKTYSQQYVDSIKNSERNAYQQLAEYKAAKEKEIIKLDENLKETSSKLDKTLDKLDATESNADKWQTLYKQAREKKDTVTQIYACDSLSQILDEQIAASDAAIQQFQYVDSLKDYKIELLQDLVKVQDQRIQEGKTALEKSTAAYEQEIKALKKLAKRRGRPIEW